MILEMKLPSPGETITEVEIAQWLVSDGEYVERDQVICEIDSEKATLELAAEESGAITILAEEGETVEVGKVVCTIDTDAKPETKVKVVEEKLVEAKEEQVPEKEVVVEKKEDQETYAKNHPSPAAKKLIDENPKKTAGLVGSGKGGRITKEDVLKALSHGSTVSASGSRNIDRQKMSMLRKKLSQRLVSVKNQTAMLTTFNEADMSGVMDMRKKYKAKFEETHGVKLGFMSFFTKAVTEALKAFPAANAMIDGDDLVYHSYMDVGIAVSSPKGLMVPVLRNAEAMSFAEIESNISLLAKKARDGKLSMEEMTGGTFTITNGGIFGSMMSTPILNPPQSAILGMHNIVERPVAIDGKIVIRPMMYLALSYDHRVIDGRESVGFLVKVKDCIENPIVLLTEGHDLEELLLDL